MRRLTIALAALAAIACGSDYNEPDPRLISGGGVGDGELSGTIHVHVIDSITERPIADAATVVADQTLQTDSNGLATFSSSQLNAPQTVRASASGYAAAAWYGVDGANVTVPLAPRSLAAALPTLTIAGTIAGWDSLAPPSAGHYLMAVVEYTRRLDMSDPANTISQGSSGGIPNNACYVDSAAITPCSFSISTRTGPQGLHAFIVDGDDRGTPGDFSDDTTTVIGFAYRGGLVGEAGVDQSAIALEIFDPSELFPVSLSFPDSILSVIGLGGIELGNDGVIVFTAEATDGSPGIVLPSLTGPFTGANYWVIGTAAPDGIGTSDQRTTFVRDIVDMESLSVGTFLDEQPALEHVDGDRYALGATSGATLRRVEVTDAVGDFRWTGLVLDTRTTIEVRALVTATGVLTARATAIEVDISPNDFALPTALRQVDRLSVGIASLSR